MKPELLPCRCGKDPQPKSRSRLMTYSGMMIHYKQYVCYDCNMQASAAREHTEDLADEVARENWNRMVME